MIWLQVKKSRQIHLDLHWSFKAISGSLDQWHKFLIIEKAHLDDLDVYLDTLDM